MHLVNGTGNSLSPGQPTPGVVKQGKSSRGSVDTTRTRSGPQRVGMCRGETPIGAAQGKQTNTTLCDLRLQGTNGAGDRAKGPPASPIRRPAAVDVVPPPLPPAAALRFGFVKEQRSLRGCSS